MNLLGKVFVTLILVLALVYLGFAVAVYSTHKNWQQEAKSKQTQLDQANAQKQELTRINETLQNELAQQVASLNARNATLQTQLVEMTTERDGLINESARLKQGEREAVAAAKQKQDTLDAKLAEIQLLREQLNEAYDDRDTHFKDAVAVTDRLNQASAELDRLKSKQVELGEQVAKARLVLDRHGLNINTPVDGIPPKLDGLVLKSGKNGLVEISLGSDEGLEKGHQLIVYRQNGSASKYLAKIEVVQTWPDRSVAQVIPESRKAPIEREDRVATRLN